MFLGSPKYKCHVIPHSPHTYFTSEHRSAKPDRTLYRGIQPIMPSTPFLLILLFLITLPIPPIPSIARGHFTPSALGFPVALSFIPRSAFTTPTPKSWEVARSLTALVTVWVGMGAVRGMKRTFQRMRGRTVRLDEPASKLIFELS